MTPRADFICLSKKCRTDEGAPTYELPTTAKSCPVCGSKRLQRIWAVNVNTGGAKERDKIVEPAFEEATKPKRDAHAAKVEGRATPPLAVPINQVAPTLAAMGRQAQLGAGKPSLIPATPSLLSLKGRTPLARPARAPHGTREDVKRAAQ
jgi:hypothetical protein